MSDTKKEALDLETLHITKQDVLDMMDGLIIRSKKNEKKKGRLANKVFGAAYRSAIRGFKGVAEMMPSSILEEVWTDICKFFNLLIIRNKMEQEKKEYGDDCTPLERVFDSLKKDIKEGNW